ncbi:siderophore-interacting protein [Gordonia humi]|uniref:NADPH-dependent ferric siderophore reductase n=1 Tax=Gordonia humi TaxID=686429 RepID=A0A840F3G3_9ACTN|nr:NADPH-dependent ferric siderophore reductase [Gordonia humi]
MAQRTITPLPLTLRRLMVLGTRRVTPRLQRVRLGGPELGAFERDGLSLPAFASPGFDDHVKVIFAAEGDVTDVLPVQLDQGIRWRASELLQTRDYTPIEVDRDRGEMSLDFVIHSDGDPAAGPGEKWARDARPGDDLWIVGPKSSTVIPDDVDWTLLVGDETAQPAIERFLAERPVAGPARIVAAISDECARRDFALGPDDEVTWVLAPSGDSSALAAAVADVVPLPGHAYVWAGAESRALLPVRKHAARGLGVPKSHVDITGYWHLREAESAVPHQESSAPRSSLVTSPVTWFAVRAALRCGLLENIDVDRPTRASLSEQGPLVDVLIDCGVVADRAGVLELTEIGDTLVTDEHAAESFDGVDAEQILALAHLADAVATGRPAWQTHTGQTFAEVADDDTRVSAELVDRSAGRVFLLPAIRRLAVFEAGRSVGFCGPGAAVVADGVGRAVEPLVGEYDAVVAVDALGYRTDDEIVDFLRGLHEVADRVVLIEATSQDALGGTGVERALIYFATVGAAPRSAERYTQLAAAAGWAQADSVALGWGVDAITLRADPRQA